jgi:uncharacterized protein YukE
MSFEGMDVDQLQGLARQIDADAQTLSDLVTTLTGVAGRLPFYWQGPVAVTFEQDWQAKYRPALLAAGNTLAALHAHLVSNINRQAAASAADSGGGTAAVISGGGVAAVLSGIGTAWGIVKAADSYLSTVETPLDWAKDLSGPAYDPRDPAFNEYGKTWSELIKLDHDSPLLKYHESSVLQWLHDTPQVKTVGEFLSKGPASEVLEKAGIVGLAVGAVSTGVDAYHTGEELGEHHYAAAGGDLVDTTADGLKTIPTPATYLAGVALTLGKEDYDMAAQTDWTALPALSSQNIRDIYVPALKDVPGQMVAPLMKAFF